MVRTCCGMAGGGSRAVSATVTASFLWRRDMWSIIDVVAGFDRVIARCDIFGVWIIKALAKGPAE
jgi:hypothetical protein